MDQLVNLQEENVRLRKAIEELSTLNDLARVISSTMSLDVVIENVIKRAVKGAHVEQGLITLVKEEKPSSMFTIIRTQDSRSHQDQFHLNQNILGWMLINKTKPLIANDFPRDPRFSGVKVEGEIKSLLCVPLLAKNRLIGVLAVINKINQSPFTDDDVRLLSIIGAQSAQVLENARLHEEEQKMIVMEKEMVAAREVQMNLLPKKLPQMPNFEFAAITLPAKDVGGDFYDIFTLDDHTYEIVVADVAGKGLPAALLATLGKGVISSQIAQHLSLESQLTASNSILRGIIPTKSFITSLLAVVNSQDRIVTIANAGHCYPLLFRNDSKSVEQIVVRGMALALAQEIRLETRSVQMHPGDCILLYSDGLEDAQNLMQEFFGEDKLTLTLQRHASDTADILLKNIVKEIQRFTAGVSQFDDITIFAIKETG
jgi:sigma-B regulation protein RsbU (phosphoserine phosphatase)